MSTTRKLLIQASVVLALGGYSLTQPASADAVALLCSTCDDSCEGAMSNPILNCNGEECGNAVMCLGDGGVTCWGQQKEFEALCYFPE